MMMMIYWMDGNYHLVRGFFFFSSQSVRYLSYNCSEQTGFARMEGIMHAWMLDNWIFLFSPFLPPPDPIISYTVMFAIDSEMWVIKSTYQSPPAPPPRVLNE